MQKNQDPTPPGELPVVAPVTAPQTPPVPTGKKILIVEDEKPLAHALEMKLKHAGYEVKAVMNGEEALTELKDGTYALALLDLIMPRMDGFSVLTELKERQSKIPVIVLSNLGQEEDRKKAAALGAVQYFVKSNTPIAEIVACVKKTIS